MNSHLGLIHRMAVIALGFFVVTPSAFAGVQCYSRDSYSSNFITAVQQELKTQGFYGGVVDGRWGQKTEGALEQFKHARVAGPPYTLGVDARTLRALFGPEADAESYGLSPNRALPPGIFAEACK